MVQNLRRALSPSQADVLQSYLFSSFFCRKLIWTMVFPPPYANKTQNPNPQLRHIRPIQLNQQYERARSNHTDMPIIP